MGQRTLGALVALAWLCTRPLLLFPSDAAVPAPADMRVTVAGLSTHYVDTGLPFEDAPVLLLVPGWLGSTGTFTELAGALAPSMRVVVLDMPAFGDTPPPACRCTPEFLGAFLRAFMDAAGLPPVVLAGTSMGAIAAVHAAVECPGRVRALILLSPFGLEGQAGIAEMTARWSPFLPAACALIPRGLFEALLRRQVVEPGSLTRGMLDGYWAPFRTAGGRQVVVDVTRLVVGASTVDAWLPRVSQPALLVDGADDPLGGPAVAGRWGVAMPRCRVVIVEGARHILQLDAPAKVAEEIARFCAGLDGAP